MNKKIKIILMTITLIVCLLLVNQAKYRNDELYAVNLKNKIDKNLVSILVSDGSNNYTNYVGTTFPSNTEYTFNSEMSKCQDSSGNVIEGILSYNEETGNANIRVKKTTYCYLYFDKIPGVKIVGNIAQGLIDSKTLWQSGLEGDGYRYTGRGNATASTSPNNFICFGTNNLSECKANEDKYMYRIIGVFSDESGEQHLKLLKYKQLATAYQWHSDDKGDISWEESDLYKGLNGISGGSYSNLFIGNATYDYLQDNTWLNKIVDWKWTATNTLRYSGGPDYKSITTERVYLHEMNRSTKTDTIGEWTYPTAKISLMYASDYRMSIGNMPLIMLKTSWLHPSNNDTTSNTMEWLMSRMGMFNLQGTHFFGWSVKDDGWIDFDVVVNEKGVSPVFYLDSAVTTSDGTGSYSNPYLLN